MPRRGESRLCMNDATRKLAVFPAPHDTAFGPREVEMPTEKCLAGWLLAGCLQLPILTLNAREIDCRRTRLMIVPPPFRRLHIELGRDQ